jgi:hypothetical protein
MATKIAVKSAKWTKNKPATSIVIASKIYPNLDFWFESKPSGNPGTLTGIRGSWVIISREVNCCHRTQADGQARGSEFSH